MKAAIFYGVLFAVILFLWYCLEYAVGLHGANIRYHEYVSYFFSVPIVLIMATAIRYRKQQLPDGLAIRFRSLFSFGVWVSLVAALVVIPVMFVFVQWVNPGFLEALSQHAIRMDGMDANQAARRFAMSSFLMLHAILILIVGTVAAFVICIIMASKRIGQLGQTV